MEMPTLGNAGFFFGNYNIFLRLAKTNIVSSYVSNSHMIPRVDFRRASFFENDVFPPPVFTWYTGHTQSSFVFIPLYYINVMIRGMVFIIITQ